MWGITLLVASLIGLASGQLSCLDVDGNPVDSWSMIKFPHGDGYAMYSSGQFTSSQNDLSNGQSALNQTFYQIYAPRSSFGYLMYNDQSPDDQEHDDNAHQKGVIAFDSQQGYWLIHSVPRFPSPLSQGGFSFPSDELTYGQSFLCLTLSTATINDIAAQFLISFPFVYDSNVPSGLQFSVPNVTAVINGKHASSASTRALQFQTVGGKDFISFSKNKEWDSELYEDLVEPYYQQGMQWETWKDGPGDMPSYCTPSYDYDSVNVESVALQDGSGLTWTSTKDHSKWGVSLSSNNPISCVGDINRQVSQARRGGGTVCSQDPSLFSAFNAIVGSSESC